MPQIKRNFAFMFLVGLAIGFSACTDAKRWLDDKADTKAKPTPLSGDPSITLKTSPTPSTTQSPKVTPATTATFTGDIAGKTGKRLLYQLLEKNEQKPVKLDVLLSDEQLEQLNDMDKKWYFDLAYPGDDGFNTGGELLIDISQGKGDLKLIGNRLTGNIIVANWSGPKQGLMSILSKPATAQSATVKQVVPKPSPSATTTVKPKQSAANNPPS